MRKNLLQDAKHLDLESLEQRINGSLRMMLQKVESWLVYKAMFQEVHTTLSSLAVDHSRVNEETLDQLVRVINAYGTDEHEDFITVCRERDCLPESEKHMLETSPKKLDSYNKKIDDPKTYRYGHYNTLIKKIFTLNNEVYDNPLNINAMNEVKELYKLLRTGVDLWWPADKESVDKKNNRLAKRKRKRDKKLGK